MDFIKIIIIVILFQYIFGCVEKTTYSGKIITNNDYSEIIIEDDGEGYPSDVLSKIGEPYIKSLKSNVKSKSGLGLGIFIGKTLLEKNFASISCKNSKKNTGAKVTIKWKNKDLLNL